MYIIEGIDGVGKSTLCNKILSGKNNVVSCLHSTSQTDNTYEWNYDMLSKGLNVVWDRSFIGEIIWSKIYKRKCKLDINQLKSLIEYAISQGFKFIYVYNKEWIHVLKSRGEMYQIKSRKRAHKLYLRLFKKFIPSDSLIIYNRLTDSHKICLRCKSLNTKVLGAPEDRYIIQCLELNCFNISVRRQ